MAPSSNYYHVGIVVNDIQAAQERLSALFGISWGPVLPISAVAYRDCDGPDLDLPTTLCYSVGDPGIELIEELPGPVWVRNEQSNLHHIGFWTDELLNDSARLAGGGCPLQLSGRAGQAAPASFAYHRDDILSVRFELVDDSIRELMA